MISILMDTYNGEKFLAEQLDSLMSQTIDDFTLWIRDDASTDSTWNILMDYTSRYPGKINLSRNEKNSGSAKHNFLDMMIDIRDDYIMLCDQDDVWLSDKIEITLAKMKKMEQQYPSTPVLVHTDLCVVDSLLNVVNPSFKWAMQSNFSRTALHQMLIQNTLTGCTAMYNRALAMLLDRKPEFCVMHDWWLQLVVSAFGKIGYLNERPILYRQHDRNEVGAKNVRTLSYKINRLRRSNEVREAIRVTYAQAESFLQIYRERMNEAQKNIVELYCTVPKKKKLFRWLTVCRLGAFKTSISRNVAYFLFI